MVSLFESSKDQGLPLPAPSPAAAGGSSLEPLFAGIADALERQDLTLALRLADRARRIAPADVHCRLLYARILIRCGQAGDALAYLTDEKAPDVLLARGMALLALKRLDKAREACNSLLARYCVDAVEGLRDFASSLVENGELPGWIGLDAELRFTGEIRGESARELFVVHKSLVPLRITERAGMFSTFVSGEVSGTVAPVKARAGTRELLGSGLLCPPDLRASGWTVLEEDHLNGEVQVAWAPRLAVMIEVSFADAEPARTLPATVEQTLCSFNLRLSPTELVARRIDVAVTTHL